MNKIFVGIDNGLSGGITAIDENQNIIKKWVMPVIKVKKTEYDINEIINIFKYIKQLNKQTYVALEHAHVRPISGKRACFMTGLGYGIMQALIGAFSFSYEIINPKQWQKNIFQGINTGDTKKDSILFCKRKWPEEDWTKTERSKKAHDGLTDSACLSEFSYRVNR